MSKFYDEYINSPAWRAKANQRLEKDRHVCQVCGEYATEVHHLTYENLGKEPMDDIVSLCDKCHQKAENLYSHDLPWAMDEKKPNGNNFMAAMRVDAYRVAPVVFDYLTEVRGSDFDSLMKLRQPNGDDKHKYWGVLSDAVNALCRKRYSYSCIEDRRDIMIQTLVDRAASICLAKIEHIIRNATQKDLHDIVLDDYAEMGTWKLVAEKRGISNGTLQKLKGDDGSSFGPSLRESVLYCCGLDAAAGLRPIEGFECLTKEDYETLNAFAEYMTQVSGSDAFKGELEA